jgi:hypothetical protein
VGRKRKYLKDANVFFQVQGGYYREVDAIIAVGDKVLKTLEVSTLRVSWPFKVAVGIANPDELLPSHVIAVALPYGLVIGGGHNEESALKMAAHFMLGSNPSTLARILHELPKKAVEVSRNEFMMACYKFEGTVH